MKNKNDGGRNADNFFLACKYVFWKFSSRWLPLTGSGQIQRKTKNPVFITILGLKDCGGFKGRQEISRYQVVPFAISANFGCNLSAKVYAGENPYKNGNFWLVCSAKNPVKSDKLALIEGKILNVMFLDINILVIPIEIWRSETKNSESRFSLIFPPYFKD